MCFVCGAASSVPCRWLAGHKWLSAGEEACHPATSDALF
jgi:hypothetical protein